MGITAECPHNICVDSFNDARFDIDQWNLDNSTRELTNE